MIVEKIESKYGKNTPIFFDEILELCNEYSKQYVCRLIKKEENEKKLKCFDRGVYYIPKKTNFGLSCISSDQVVEKKYIKNDKEVYGVYCGLNLLNSFGITTQMPNIIEIVTNYEATRKREITISNRNYIVRKSKCVITNKNYAAYTILQLFNDLDDNDVINDTSLKRINSFMEKNKVNIKQLLEISEYFPAKAVKRMMRSTLFYGSL